MEIGDRPRQQRLPVFGEPLFRDRVDAGRQLAKALVDERAPAVVVIGLARGGVEVAAEVARLWAHRSTSSPFARSVIPGSPSTRSARSPPAAASSCALRTA
jgi:hypothetical protein